MKDSLYVKTTVSCKLLTVASFLRQIQLLREVADNPHFVGVRIYKGFSSHRFT